MMPFHNSSAAKKAGEVYCVGLIRRMIERGHGEAVRAGLAAIRTYDVAGRVALYSDFILKPFLGALVMVPFPADALAGFLQRHDPYKVLDGAAKNGMQGQRAFEIILRDEVMRGVV